MLIHCTKRVLDAARITDAGYDLGYEDLTDKNLLFSWHTHNGKYDYPYTRFVEAMHEFYEDGDKEILDARTI